MEKAYNISEIRFENDNFILIVDNQTMRLKLENISRKLKFATEHQRNDYNTESSESSTVGI